MLQAVGLSKRYGAHLALDRLDLEVKGGDIYCLLGANGAGKTTTVNLFLNFIQPTEGAALINRTDVAREPVLTKRDVAYIPEMVSLYPSLSGLENLRFFAALGTGRELADAELLQLLDQVGLAREAADQRVRGYSKGMRQKVWIAVAMAKQAKAFLLDEPTSGLDPHAADEFSSLLQAAAGRGMAVLTTTHDLFHARQTATRIGIMKGGRLVESLSQSEIAATDLQALYLRHMRS